MSSKLLDTLAGVASIFWLVLGMYHSVNHNYDQATYSLAWAIICSMVTRFDKNA